MTEQERFDAIVVGAGPSGLSAGYFLAKKGLNVAVLERGTEVGSKNVFGGRIYAHVFDKNFQGWRNEAPVERWVKKEKMALLCKSGSVSFEFEREKGQGSFTAFLNPFLNWLSSLVESEGGTVATGVKVDSINFENGYARGVTAGPDKLEADYVVIAEGANTLLSEKHGIKRAPGLDETSLGIKEVIKLGKDTINKRLSLEDDEGVAQFILGEPLQGLSGGGFFYTMKEYVTVGAVVRLSEFARKRYNAKDLVEDLRLSPYLTKVLEGGTLVEYSAHLVPESGFKGVLKKPYGNGFLVAGDAAGFLLNTGFTIRGVDMAVESGRLAAEAIAKAHSEGGNSEELLSSYGKLLDESFIMKNLRKFSRTADFLSDNKIYKNYVNLACSTVKGVFDEGEEAKRAFESFRKALNIQGISFLTVLKDAWEAYRSI
ncbi:MAG: FAD-dependent oxidoreductase [Nitrososphaeria archaeon]|nr:FAD-dependent oxidoreductase [Conexivisphaerales archaeon]